MISEVEPSEPVSIGLMNRLWMFLTRDIEDDRRPKHPRPELPAGYFGGLRNPMDNGSPRPKPPQLAPIDVGRPPSGGSGACPPPPPKKPTTNDDPEPMIEGEVPAPINMNIAGLIPRPPKVSTIEDRPRSRIEGESIETDLRGGFRQNGEGAENALLTTAEKKDHDQLPTEKSWRKRETETALATSSAWWTAIKWIFGVGASIGAGWLIEWAVF